MLKIKLSQNEQANMKAFAEQMKSQDPKKIREQVLESMETCGLKKIIAHKIEAWFQSKYGDLSTMNYGEAWRVE